MSLCLFVLFDQPDAVNFNQHIGLSAGVKAQSGNDAAPATVFVNGQTILVPLPVYAHLKPNARCLAFRNCRRPPEKLSHVFGGTRFRGRGARQFCQAHSDDDEGILTCPKPNWRTEEGRVVACRLSLQASIRYLHFSHLHPIRPTLIVPLKLPSVFVQRQPFNFLEWQPDINGREGQGALWERQ